MYKRQDPVKLRKFCEKECHVEQKQLIHTASGKKIKAVIVCLLYTSPLIMDEPGRLCVQTEKKQAEIEYNSPLQYKMCIRDRNGSESTNK